MASGRFVANRDAARESARTIPRSVLLDGSHGGRTEPLALTAGPLSLLFEDGGLRYVRYGDHEIVRRVYCAVRDANWGTVPHQISNLRADLHDDSFRIAFDVENQQGEIDFAWRGTITGETYGRIVFEMDGISRSTFRKNRIGFCVLHPMECAGAQVEVHHADGSTERSQFPRYIAPWNPLLNVVGLSHSVADGVQAAVRFEGDVFETEDQRNWIDASFKTFCTPLSRPFPVEVRAGERIAQKVTIELLGQPQPAIHTKRTEREVALHVDMRPLGPLPEIGFGLPTDAEPLSPTEIQRLQLLRPRHLRCELRLSSDVEPILHQAITTATELNTKLELALFVGQDAQRELDQLIALVDRLRPAVARWTIFPETGWATTRDLAETGRKRLRRYDPYILMGGGSSASFLELNRQRPPIEALDFVVWSQQPQEHAFDNASLVETLAAHAATVESARQLADRLPPVVGPITLNKRVNPYATGAWPPPLKFGELPPSVDVRQMSLFGAGWTLGSIKYLAEQGVQAVTYYELVGWKGLMECAAGSPLPALFPSLPGCVFPLYHVFADLAEHATFQVLPIRSSAPLRVEALALTSGPLTRVIIVNLTGQPQRITLPTPATSVRMRLLDERNVLNAMTSPADYRSTNDFVQTVEDGILTLELLPYAVVRTDWT